MLRIGPYDIRSVVTGTFRLDGGAMFGVVPKALWANNTPPDELNRIPLVTRTLLAVDRASGITILVDTGCGTKWDPQKAERFAIKHDPCAISRALKEFNLSSDDVTDVVVTHLHFDHNGGLTHWQGEPGGPTHLAFPHARHWIHRAHWEHARQPHLKDRASFLQEDFAGLREAGVLRLVGGDKPDPSINGVDWFVSHGHTPYQLHPLFRSAGDGLIFAGDLVPTIAHLKLPWVMAYDVAPTTTIDEKRRLFQLARTEGLAIAFCHEPTLGAVRIGGTVERPIVEQTALP